MASVRAAFCACLFVVGAEADAAADHPPLPGLKRVIVLARHGNRAPNPQIHMLCPNFAKHVLPGFVVSPAALSRVGMAENEENGKFIRHRYQEFLPDGPYPYDGTFTFFSERAGRNIVSTQSFARGMFPVGTGLHGFTKDDPNLVPISTTQDGADVLMNCPRDGPCQHALQSDIAQWTKEHGNTVYDENKELFHNVSAACGYDIRPGNIVWQGKPKDIGWAAKGVMDALTFAQNEGLDATMGGRLSLETITQFHHKVEAMVQDTMFGKPHQITYWGGDFIPTVLKLARMPLVDPVNKFHLFLNHRELLFAVAHQWNIPIQFPGSPPGAFPAGSSLVMEVYDSGMRLFFWQPSKPPLEMKAHYLKKDLPMDELYSYGTLTTVEPKGCKSGIICPVDQLALSFVDSVQRTGTYVDICNVSLEDTYFARGEASLDIMEEWVQPLLAKPPKAMREAARATANEELTVSASSARARRRPPLGEANGVSIATAAVSAAVLAAITGGFGFALGRRSSKEKDRVFTAAAEVARPYVLLS